MRLLKISREVGVILSGLVNETIVPDNRTWDSLTQSPTHPSPHSPGGSMKGSILVKFKSTQ